MDALQPGRTAAQEERLARARALVPVLRDRAEQTNMARRVPAETIKDYWDTGLWGILKPRRYGGQEARYDDFLDIATELGRGDGSAAWVYAVVGVHELMISLYPQEVQDEIWSDPRAIVSSSFAPGGQPTKEKGGYRLSGRWQFCSGIDSSQWIILGAMFGMVGDPPHPDIRFVILPMSDCKIVDDWHVMGLKGTGSKSVIVENAFVPDYRIVSGDDLANGWAPGGKLHSGNIYRAPTWAVFPFCLSASAAGVARGGLEQFIAGMKQRMSTFDHQGLAQMRHIQMRVSEAAALIDSAELLYKRSAHETVDKIENGETLTLEHRVRSRRDQAYSVVQATHAMELLSKCLGGKGLYDKDPVRRAFCDLQAIGAHVAVTWDLPSASYASVMFGGPPLDFLF